ncbi:hypothetical protein H6F43_00890 [Leptolyngbya sp. FACHB-36]|uniref:hypothetical protein n=1 Tax=Leptolyngbya sp. FACHB-36 TaxID=2692808 RepID=UPI00168114A7|nr:hypothetical protein [Leptolyngbya sp. FACHB-36]MBD2018738.1 hypothetical protein [Leptolyngbya sp. FACHB-36]
MFTEADRKALQSAQLERLRTFFAESLGSAEMHLTLDAALVIVLSAPQQVDGLLADVDLFRYFVWLVTGAGAIKVYYAGEEVWSALTRDAIELEAILQYEDATMTAVTIERLLQDTPQPTTTADDRLLPLSQVAEQIANLTGQSAELITNGILSTGAVRVRSGEWVVPSNIGDAAIDSYAADLAARMKSQIRNGVAEAPQAELPVETNGNGAAAAIVETPETPETVEPKPAAKKPAATNTKKTPAKKATTKKPGRPAAKKSEPQPEAEAEAAPTA